MSTVPIAGFAAPAHRTPLHYRQHLFRGRQARHGDIWPLCGYEVALEAVSDSLRRELAPLGVKVVVIEPGAVTTAMLGQVERRGEQIVRGMTDEQRGRYATLMHAVVAQARASIAGASSPENAGRVIAKRDH